MATFWLLSKIFLCLLIAITIMGKIALVGQDKEPDVHTPQEAILSLIFDGFLLYYIITQS